MSKSKLNYRPDIDGLRTVAVISVILHHAWPKQFGGGFIGVDIFFVISGYLISSILVGQLETNRFSVLDFYSRRARRIFPTLLLVLFATLGFGWFVLLASEFRQIGGHVAAGGMFVSNLVLWHEAGYFDSSGTTKPLLHLWSLGVEEQFYIVWPLLLWLIHSRKINFYALCASVFVLSFAANMFLVRTNLTAAYYSPASRFWELMVGGVGAQLSAQHKPWTGVRSHVASLVGAACLVLGFVLITPQDAFPGVWALLPVGGAFLLVMAGPSALVNRYVLSNKLAVGIGLISYPLYLWHWPLLSYAYVICGDRPPTYIRIGAIAAAFGLAVLTYRFLESRIKVQKKASHGKTALGLAGGMAVAVVVGLLVMSGVVRERIEANGADLYINALNDRDFPGHTLAPLRHQDVTFQKVSSQSGGVTVFMGDSLAEHYGPYVEQLIAQSPSASSSVVFATMGRCPPIKGAVPLPRAKFYRCTATVDAAYDFANRPEVDTVVVAAAWNSYFSDSYNELAFDTGSETLRFPSATAKDHAIESLKQTLTTLRSNGKRVFVVLQPPTGPAFDPRNMYTGSRFASLRPLASIAPVALDTFLAANAEARQRMIAVAHEAQATAIDPTTSVCSHGACPVLGADGTPAYSDTMHMRPRYSRVAASFLEPTIMHAVVSANE